MLSQYPINTGFATKHILKGIKVAGAAMTTGNAPKVMKPSINAQCRRGIVDPQNTFMLTGLERGGTGTTSKTWTATKHLLVYLLQSESLNRKAVFVASLEVAKIKGRYMVKTKGFDSAYDFAVDVIAQTQGRVQQGQSANNWAHSQLGAPL